MVGDTFLLQMHSNKVDSVAKDDCFRAAYCKCFILVVQLYTLVNVLLLIFVRL